MSAADWLLIYILTHSCRPPPRLSHYDVVAREPLNSNFWSYGSMSRVILNLQIGSLLRQRFVHLILPVYKVLPFGNRLT